MAKRKSGVTTRPWSESREYYDIWVDEDLVPKLEAIEGVRKVSKRGPTCLSAPYYIQLDPRYGADEVIAEIEALGKPNVFPALGPCVRPTLGERARCLGRDAAEAGRIGQMARCYLEASEENRSTENQRMVLFTLLRGIVTRLEHGHW
uniref:Uncharacterized protein n=1 Tax=viral metagenome TaxID=1070528 RepID=A0A6M3X710_9ZZZZ